MRKWLRLLGLFSLLFLLLFLGMHAIMPAGEEHSKHPPPQDASAWKPIEVVTGEPSSGIDHKSGRVKNSSI